MMASQTLALIFFCSLSSPVKGFQIFVMKTWSKSSAAKTIQIFTQVMMQFSHQFLFLQSSLLLHHLEISLLQESPPPSTRLPDLMKESLPIKSSWILKLKEPTNFVSWQFLPNQGSIGFLLRWGLQWSNKHLKGLLLQPSSEDDLLAAKLKLKSAK